MSRPGRTRRSLLGGLTRAALAGAVLAACGPSEDLEELPKTGTSEGKVVYATWGTPAQRESENWSLMAFEKNYTDLKVDVIWAATAAEHVAKQISMRSAGAPPDVVRLPSWAAFTFYHEDSIRRLDAYFKRDGFRTDHLAQPFDVATFNRRWHGLPRGQAGAWVVFYNRKLFDSVGLKAPETGWTWDDFLRNARALTRPVSGSGQAQWGTSVDAIADFYYPWLWGNGGEDIERTGEKSLLDSAPSREALQWIADLRLKHQVAPPAGELPDGPAAFATGRLGMWFGPADAELELAKLSPPDFAMAPQPKGKQGQQSAYKPDVTCLSFAAQYPDDGWELMQFLMDVDVQRLEFGNGLWYPQSREIVGKAEFQKPAGAPHDRRPGIPNALFKSRSPVMLPRGDEMRAANLRELAPFWRGTKSVDAATDAAAKAVNAILNGEA